MFYDFKTNRKLNWKVQRDMEERGHSLESILASIEARTPDFAAYVAPQKQHADMIITVLPTKLDPNDKKTLRVQCIQRRRNRNFSPFYLFDEGSQIEWTPSYFLSRQDPGLKFISGPTLYSDESTVSQKGGEIVDLLEMDGSFSNIQELVYIEYHLRNIRCQFYGELAMSMMKLTDAPGSFDGTGLMQTLAAFAIRSIYERNLAKMVNLIK
jgi:phosphoribulokinase